MKRSKEEIRNFAYMQAAYAMDLTSYIPINATDNEEEFEDGYINIESSFPNPEDQVLNTDFYKKLSANTKSILTLLFCSNQLTRPTKQAFYKAVKPFMKGKPKEKQKTINELKEFVNTFLT